MKDLVVKPGALNEGPVGKARSFPKNELPVGKARSLP
jgi:hypothetical protein